MTLTQQLITIAILALGTMATRFLPFLIFRDSKPAPKYIQYLGNALPAAIFAMLVVYCLKAVDLTAFSYGLPELIALLATVGVHLWKRQMILSILTGTVCYMLLVQLVF